MKISFVIPAHNEELRLRACVESVEAEIARTGYDAEVIVVDNASTDKTGEIARSFPSVKLVEEPRKGLSQARQSGFEASKGDLIANIDADTMVPSGWLDTAVRSFSNEPGLVALSGPFFYFDLSLWQRAWVRLFYIGGYLIYLTVHLFKMGAMLQGGNFVLRRSALERIGGFNTSLHFWGEDTDVARRIRAVGEVRWTFALIIHSSGRRIAHDGLFRAGINNAVNFFWTTFAKKPWHEGHMNEVRSDWHEVRRGRVKETAQVR